MEHRQFEPSINPAGHVDYYFMCFFSFNGLHQVGCDGFCFHPSTPYSACVLLDRFLGYRLQHDLSMLVWTAIRSIKYCFTFVCYFLVETIAYSAAPGIHAQWTVSAFAGCGGTAYFCENQRTWHTIDGESGAAYRGTVLPFTVCTCGVDCAYRAAVPHAYSDPVYLIFAYELVAVWLV